MTVRVAESCGTLATVTDALTREELARTALACPPFSLALRLAEWVGDSRELTSTSPSFLAKLILWMFPQVRICGWRLIAYDLTARSPLCQVEGLV